MSTNFKELKISPESIELLEALKVSEYKELEVQFTLDKYYTGNMMYDFVSPRNTNKVHVMLNNDVRKMKSDITEQVNKLPQVINCKDSLSDVKAYFAYGVLHNEWTTKRYKSLKRIDLTNVWKICEDAAMESLGVDDSKCIDLRLVKALNSPDNKGLFTINYTLFR